MQRVRYRKVQFLLQQILKTLSSIASASTKRSAEQTLNSDMDSEAVYKIAMQWIDSRRENPIVDIVLICGSSKPEGERTHTRPLPASKMRYHIASSGADDFSSLQDSSSSFNLSGYPSGNN